ncbi:MAG: methyltransferase [Promethearchaeota archaeon]
MSCCQRQVLETTFDRTIAETELKQYREKGMKRTTRLLVDALKAQGVKGKTLLDIGGGIGVIQHELFKSGLQHSINVEASLAYISATKDEATRQGHADRISHHHGDFIDLAPTFSATDIVTLDKVICCYDDWQSLVEQSSSLARTYYGIVIPRTNLLSRLSIGLENFSLWVRHHPFRTLIHPVDDIDNLLHRLGFKQLLQQNTVVWHMKVYVRQGC